ncbi:hypothetical protein HKD27_12070 [Gluconobacter sp. R75690]|uniref:hypothetical protein n=1 Tax=unclassified Gluconobacter TaxID=2644261 RepID=UPI00188A7F2A|nr:MULTISPECIES: hypothetical protein [unclassified Gluconobacter]MBF0851645.1 hypothetical protein [Gluconobacter sp. R75690]MBF0880707.1 hypothetical protein [Gluconobacter sp. R75828]
MVYWVWLAVVERFVGFVERYPDYMYVDNCWHFDGRFPEHKYFVFIEEIGPINPEGIMRPDERPFGDNILNETLRDRSWRIRASGIKTQDFYENMSEFEVLDHDNVTDDQRRRRKNHLNELFGVTTLPIVDIYLGSEDAFLQYSRDNINPGAWYFVGVGQPSDIGIPVFIGAAELPSDLYIDGSLLLFMDIIPGVESRLRDIFSLVHIPDADFGEDTGGSTEPLPPEPGVGPEPNRSAKADLNLSQAGT